jgi:diadenosine tetraphosphatase ApaH/serine/threonine PP2A family protein phosphatase
VPGVFLEQAPDDIYQFHSPEEIDYKHPLDHRKTLVNVGSVGQPRDGDPRACYVLLDADTLRYRRVEYDIETTIKKMRDVPELDPFLADRLRAGR